LASRPKPRFASAHGHSLSPLSNELKDKLARTLKNALQPLQQLRFKREHREQSHRPFHTNVQSTTENAHHPQVHMRHNPDHVVTPVRHHTQQHHTPATAHTEHETQHHNAHPVNGAAHHASTGPSLLEEHEQNNEPSEEDLADRSNEHWLNALKEDMQSLDQLDAPTARHQSRSRLPL